MNTSDTLNLAADLIEKRGWSRGTSGWDRGDALCLEGGIMAAAGIDSLVAVGECPATAAVVEYLGAENCTFTSSLTGDTSIRPWVWNDSRERTATEVIEVLRAAAVIEAAKENADVRVEATA